MNDIQAQWTKKNKSKKAAVNSSQDPIPPPYTWPAMAEMMVKCFPLDLNATLAASNYYS